MDLPLLKKYIEYDPKVNAESGKGLPPSSASLGGTLFKVLACLTCNTKKTLKKEYQSINESSRNNCGNTTRKYQKSD